MTRPSITIALLATMLIAVGCQSEDRGGASAGEAVTVRLMAYDGYVMSDELKERIRQEHRIDVQVLSSGDVPAALAAAVLGGGSAGFDVLFGVDTSLMPRAEAARDTFATTDLGETPRGIRQIADGRFTSIDDSFVCFNYDRTWFATNGIEPPRSVEDLTLPQFASKVVVPDPASSSPGMMALLGRGVVLGDQAADWWKRLIDGGALIVGSWSDAYFTNFTAGGQQGTRPIVLSYASSPPAEVVSSADESAAPSSEVLEDSCVHQVEYAAVLSGSPVLDQARELIRVMVSGPFQEAQPLSNFVYPARADTQLPPLFARFAPRPIAIAVPDDLVRDRAEQWLEQYRSATGR